jgi:poly(3-hydroxybutyrate) depolymerase
MIRYCVMLVLAALMAGCGSDEAPVPNVPVHNIDTTRITVSGVSSGAMMATQMHIALSGLVGGAAMVSGGPYYCAEASLKKGLGPCMKGGDLGLPALLAYARDSSESGTIDPLANVAGDPVWLFHGANDVVMHPDVTAAANDFYAALDARVTVVADEVPAAHGVPTLDKGVACELMESPFLNACDYDAAGELLQTLYGDLQPRGSAASELIEVPQPDASAATMLANALAYIPESCRAGQLCGMHIAFHGCQQSTAFVGDAFAKDAGYNEWAETNNLIVLYPQVDSSKIAPMNPMGCWDWWGYTDEHYATKSGSQLVVVKAMIDLLAGKTL